MLNAIQAGILTSSTKERLEALEGQKKDLEAKIAEEKLAKPVMKEEFVRFCCCTFASWTCPKRSSGRRWWILLLMQFTFMMIKC